MGVITLDTIALVDNYPAEDERVLAQEIARAGGGPAAVAAVTLSRLGISSAIVGTIGDDADGQEVLQIFKRENVDFSGVALGKSPTAGSVIVASTARAARAISTRQPVEQAPLNKAAQELIEQAQWLHLDHIGIERVNRREVARGDRAKISFDAGYGVDNFEVNKVDLFAPTHRQMRLRHPDLELSQAIAADAKSGNCTVVATQGPLGSMGYSADTGLVKAAGFSVDVKSTLGAGDVFHGALLAQLIQGFTLPESLLRSNAVAALSCRGLDGQSMIPTTSELEKFLEKNK